MLLLKLFWQFIWLWFAYCNCELSVLIDLDNKSCISPLTFVIRQSLTCKDFYSFSNGNNHQYTYYEHCG